MQIHTIVTKVAGQQACRRLGQLAACLVFGAACSQAFAQTPPSGAADAASPDSHGTSLAQIASQFEKSPNTIVAEVNGTPITAGMVADHIRDLSPALAVLPASMIYERSVDDLAQQRSLAVKARELGLDKDPAVRRRVEEETDHALANALIRHITPEMINEKVIADRYAAVIAGKPGATEVQLRVIVTESEAAANDALASVRAGADFAKVAQAVSIDATRALGGAAGYATRDRLVPELGAVAFSLMPGQMTQFPVLSGGRWFIVKVESRRQQATPSLEASRERLVAELSREAAVQIIRRTRAAVVVNDYGPMGQRRDGGVAVSVRQ